ncbi:hypothetical protein EJ110_NYTH36132 [Nymphaea thermarum]|nr:hypothetical protein EJ110_NYTH36132 [Nymphaea thermarum]
MDQTFIFLGGLRDEFESIRSQILNCDEIPGIEEVYARVESEEQRRQVMHIDSSHGSSPSAFVSRASGTGQRPVRRCSHCNKLGHSVDFCWDIHPEKRLVRGRPPSSRRDSSVPDSSQGSSSTVEKSKLSSDQIKELQAYISRLSTTQEETSTFEGAKLAQALVATSDQVRGDSDSHVGGNSVKDQPTACDHLFGQVYTRKKTDVVEDVDVTNPNPVSSPDDPSPIDEELPIALRKGTRQLTCTGLTTDFNTNLPAPLNFNDALTVRIHQAPHDQADQNFSGAGSEHAGDRSPRASRGRKRTTANDTHQTMANSKGGLGQQQRSTKWRATVSAE